MSSTQHHQLSKSRGTVQLWDIAADLVIPGEHFGWSYGWGTAGTLGFLVTAGFVAPMCTTFTSAAPNSPPRSRMPAAPSPMPAQGWAGPAPVSPAWRR